MGGVKTPTKYPEKNGQPGRRLSWRPKNRIKAGGERKEKSAIVKAKRKFKSVIDKYKSEKTKVRIRPLRIVDSPYDEMQTTP